MRNEMAAIQLHGMKNTLHNLNKAFQGWISSSMPKLLYSLKPTSELKRYLTLGRCKKTLGFPDGKLIADMLDLAKKQQPNLAQWRATKNDKKN